MRVIRTDLSHSHELEGVVVVVDVLRAFSTAAYAFAAGARAMAVAHSTAEIEALRRRHRPSITVGAQAGGVPIVGLDHGNSPASVASLDLAGTTVIEYTAGGVRGLVDCDHASAVLAGSLVCARATAEYIRRLRPEQVTFMITGLWIDRDGDEDHACADLIEAHLAGEQPWLEDFERRVRESDFGRRFGDPARPHLPRADLELCARADCFDFAMPMQRRGGDLLIEPVPVTEFA
ncbi:MAG TPA: 2-phosphosulfolactate phosphatase [Burkholderiaceae bacterium]|nr:2-phosphosulfolactate phosphatase [Burkholderiaceae bacterium]